ncbi:MAG: CPBP family intramembrane metalloprotease [Candidatus Obscuribacterales bacterium]|nr:CPBP family intramembrane metalloprotease [Candidatus Obscuribacterales bacterium]
MANPDFARGMAVSAIELSIVFGPLLVVGLTRRSKNLCVAAGLSVLLGLMQLAIIYSPSIGFLAALKYNWLQKLASFALSLLWCKAASYNFRECGFVWPSRKIAFLWAFLIGTIICLPDLILSLSELTKTTTETLLFELTMPGLQEEALYRGLMLFILDKYLGCPWRIFKVQFGWGSILSTLFFTLGHLMMVDKQWHIQCSTDFLAWIDLIVFSFAMCWIRYRWGSIWPAVVAHNAGNSVISIVSIFVGK